MTTPNDELQSEVQELYDYLCNENLGNAWEQDFMLSIWKQFIEQGGSLSVKQVKKVEELYYKHMLKDEAAFDDYGFLDD